MLEVLARSETRPESKQYFFSVQSLTESRQSGPEWDKIDIFQNIVSSRSRWNTIVQLILAHFGLHYEIFI